MSTAAWWRRRRIQAAGAQTLLLLLAAWGVWPAMAQDTRAGRELENGIRLARDGKLNQAITAWQQVVERYPDAPEAPAALLRLARAAYPVSRFAERGRGGAPDPAEGKRLLERIIDDYRTSPQAPEALLTLGWLRSDGATAFYDLDEAYGLFSSLVNVYTGSAAESAGLLGQADVLIRQNNCRRAMQPLARIDARFAASPWADEALLRQAECLWKTADAVEAMRSYQRLRDEHPDSPWAKEARERNTHLARLHHAGEEPLYQRTEFLRLQLPAAWSLRSVNQLAVDDAGNLYVVDTRMDVVHIFDRQGALAGQIEARRPTAVLPAAEQPRTFADGALVTGSGASPLLLEGGAALAGPVGLLAEDLQGRLLIWDRRSGHIFRFGQDLALLGRAVDGDERKVDGAVMSANGTLVVLNQKGRELTYQDPSGELRSLPLADSMLRRPTLEAVDFLGNVVLMDAGNRIVELRSPDGEMLARLTSGKADGDPFPRPEALAMNTRGEILIYDQRRGGVVVFR